MNDTARSPWLDVSVPLRDRMLHWPGDPPASVTRVKDMARGDSANVSLLCMGSHSGTHVDAPIHFFSDDKGVDSADLNVLVGRARVIEVGTAGSITVEELLRHRIRHGERILLKTHNSSTPWHENPFIEDFVYLADDAARYLVNRGVSLVGADYLSVGSYRHGGREVHRLLLNGGVWVIEGLSLYGVAAGSYELICLPLRLVGGDGAPARAILRTAQVP